MLKGKQLKAIRKRMSKTQKELGKMLGVATNTVARWERDELPIPGYLHLALAELSRRELESEPKK